MSIKENMRHPNFIVGAMSFIILLTGVVVKGNKYRIGDYMIMLSVALGGLHWMWSIIDVVKNHQINAKSRPFWIIVVLIIPPVGGMIYYMMREKNVRL
jgi:hypothetical protein